MQVAVIQMLSGVQLEANLLRAEALLKEAAARGATLALLPENFPLMGRQEEDKFSIAEDENGRIHQWLRRLATELRLCIIGGTIPLRHPVEPRVYAHVPVFDSRGKKIAAYNKLHLFDVQLPDGKESYVESRGIVPGAQLVTVECGAARIGLSVCYDLRFPELYRALTAAGANVLVVPAAFTDTTGKAHWLTLLRARAIENQCFVLAANQGGEHENGRKTFGHSLIIDPWGEVLAELEYGEAVAVAELDFAAQEQLRQRFPVLQHQRIAIGALEQAK